MRQAAARRRPGRLSGDASTTFVYVEPALTLN
jgi:hypothetical protein